MRAAVTAALEALEAGDEREAVAILLNALEDGPVVQHRATCPVCGIGFEWPGLLDRHLDVAHLEAARAA